MRIRDGVAVRGQRRAEHRHGSVVEFPGVAGPIRWGLVAGGGGTEAVAGSDGRTEWDGRLKTGVCSGHQRGKR